MNVVIPKTFPQELIDKILLYCEYDVINKLGEKNVSEYVWKNKVIFIPLEAWVCQNVGLAFPFVMYNNSYSEVEIESISNEDEYLNII
jgi:hypothetical protein